LVGSADEVRVLLPNPGQNAIDHILLGTIPMPASREDLFKRFQELGIETKTVEHAPVFTVEEAQRVHGNIPGGHCKNLFCKDEKGVLWLIVCLEDARVDLKKAPVIIGSKRLSFGRADLLMQVLGVEPGSVTPFALINDTGTSVNVVLDKAMMVHEFLNYHPLRNDATTTIRSDDLLRFIRSCGHQPSIHAVSEAPL
jgi:Ala-tRNA(Pro) deacylase